MEPTKRLSKRLTPIVVKNLIVSNSVLTADTSLSNHPFVLEGIALAICTKGNGKMRINFREYKIEKNMIIAILPHFVTELLERSDDVEIESLSFSLDFLTETLLPSNFDVSKKIIQSPCIKVSDEEVGELLDFYAFIKKQYNRNEHPFREAMAKNLLAALLAEISSIYSLRAAKETNFETSHQENLVYSFFQLLLNHHQQERGLPFYANKIFLTTKYLSTVIKMTTGRTATAWINEAVVASAKYMMKTSKLTILQISEELNFPNASFFGRFFKKHTGLTPLQYRAS